jgi:hypothetical protein
MEHRKNRKLNEAKPINLLAALKTYRKESVPIFSQIKTMIYLQYNTFKHFSRCKK